jgi:hypothetical protein
MRIDTLLNTVFGFICPDDLIHRKVNRKLLFVALRGLDSQGQKQELLAFFKFCKKILDRYLMNY